jgi:hypothetical protein
MGTYIAMDHTSFMKKKKRERNGSHREGDVLTLTVQHTGGWNTKTVVGSLY